MRPAALLALLLGAVACTPGGLQPAAASPRPAPPGAASPAAPYQPEAALREGGVITVGTAALPAAGSPLFGGQVAGNPLAPALFSGLTALDPSLRWFGDLAAEVPTPANGGVRVSGQGMDVTYRLREGLRWSDGEPVTPEDVIFTLQVITGPAAAAGAAQEGYERIRSAEGLGSRGVVLHFSSLYPAYLNLFSAILPRHRLARVPADALPRDGYWVRPDVVSGPFTLQELEPDRATLLRNPAYAAGREGMPVLGHQGHADRIIFRGLRSRQAVLAALKAGDIQAGLDLTERELSTIAGLKSLRVQLTPALQYEQVSFNQAAAGAPWAGDERVLEALDLATDRPALLRGPLGGRPPPASTPLSPLLGWAHDGALPDPPHDPRAAERILDADGWARGGDGIRQKNGRRLAFTLSTTAEQPLRAEEADIVAAGWRRLGIDVRVENYPSSRLFGSYDQNGVLARGQFEAALWAWITPPDPDAEFGVLHSSRAPGPDLKSGQNYSRCHDAAIDQALASGRSTLDPAARGAAYRGFEAAYLRARCELPLYRRLAIGVSSFRLRNFAPHPAAAATWNAADWWLDR